MLLKQTRLVAVFTLCTGVVPFSALALEAPPAECGATLPAPAETGLSPEVVRALASAGFSRAERERMERLAHVEAPLSGPNCWNAAAYVKGLAPLVLLTSSQQAERLFTQSCRKLDVRREEAPAGALLRYRSAGDEQHAFLALGEGKFFQKRDNSKDGPYEVVDLKSVDEIYGREATCGGRPDCDWSFEVLDCAPGKTFQTWKQAPAEFQGFALAVSLLSLSKPEETDIALDELDRALGRLEQPESVRAIQAYLRRADQNSALSLFDLAQTVRLFASDLIARVGAEKAQGLKKRVDAALWPLVESYLDRKKLSQNELAAAYDFVYGASGAGPAPARLRDRIATSFARVAPVPDALAAARLGLVTNPNVAYEDAAPIVKAAVARAIATQSEDLVSTLGTFFLYSVSPVPEKDQLLRAVVEKGKFTDNFAIASDYLDAIGKSGLSPEEKAALVAKVLSHQDASTATALRDRLP